MRIIKNNYIFKSNFNKKIALISDIHYSNFLNIKDLYGINEYIKDQNVDYICIVGDIIDSNDFLTNEERNNEFLQWMERLSKIATVIISVGNHDIIVDENYNRCWNETFFNNISKLDNVYLLDNKIYEDENIRFLGYTSIYDYHDRLKDIKLYVNDYKKVFGDIRKDKYNVLLCHSPRMITKDEIITKISISKSIDLVLSGHMHNGMYLPIMEKFSHSNRGLVSPYKRLFPKIARGKIHKDYENYSIDFIISGGITKLSEKSSKILKYFNFLYPPHVEIISIEGDNNGKNNIS